MNISCEEVPCRDSVWCQWFCFPDAFCKTSTKCLWRPLHLWGQYIGRSSSSSRNITLAAMSISPQLWQHLPTNHEIPWNFFNCKIPWGFLMFPAAFWSFHPLSKRRRRNSPHNVWRSSEHVGKQRWRLWDRGELVKCLETRDTDKPNKKCWISPWNWRFW